MLTGNASEKDGLQAALDLAGLKLTLTSAKLLAGYCEKVRIAHDFLERPGPVPVPGEKPVTVPLGIRRSE